jgi:hypothetical protein
MIRSAGVQRLCLLTVMPALCAGIPVFAPTRPSPQAGEGREGASMVGTSPAMTTWSVRVDNCWSFLQCGCGETSIFAQVRRRGIHPSQLRV